MKWELKKLDQGVMTSMGKIMVLGIIQQYSITDLGSRPIVTMPVIVL